MVTGWFIYENVFRCVRAHVMQDTSYGTDNIFLYCIVGGRVLSIADKKECDALLILNMNLFPINTKVPVTRLNVAAQGLHSFCTCYKKVFCARVIPIECD